MSALYTSRTLYSKRTTNHFGLRVSLLRVALYNYIIEKTTRMKGFIRLSDTSGSCVYIPGKNWKTHMTIFNQYCKINVFFWNSTSFINLPSQNVLQQGSRETRKDAEECKSPTILFAYQIVCSTHDQIRWKLYHLSRGSIVRGIKSRI